MSQIYKSSGSGPAPDTETLTGNTGGAVGPDAAFNINLLGATLYTVDGNPGTNTLTINPRVNAYPITPYVVGPVGEAGYQTIQSALDAADAAGGGIVYVQPGVYNENLTLYGTTEIVGTPGNSDLGTSGNTVTIFGVHTPPTTGSFTAVNVLLQSATHIFSSNAAGSAAIILENSTSQITNGYLFNLPNWTSNGSFTTYNMADFSTDNGMVNNTGGATVFFISATHGAGTANPMITSGPVNMQEIDLNCPWNAQTGTTIACDYVIFTQTVTCSNNSTGTFTNSRWTTGASAPLIMDSTATIEIISSVLNSSNNPVINGSGSGNLILSGNTYLDDDHIAIGLTTPNLLHSISGTGTTIDVATSDLITYALRNVAAVYQFQALVSGISATGSAFGTELIGVIKTNGAAATIVGTVDQTVNKDLAISGASVAALASGNDLVIRATGSLGAVINWNVNLTFKQITN